MDNHYGKFIHNNIWYTDAHILVNIDDIGELHTG